MQELLRVRKKFLAAEGRRQRCAYDRRFRYFQQSLMVSHTFAHQPRVENFSEKLTRRAQGAYRLVAPPDRLSPR